MKAARREMHQTLKQATYDYERIQYNTVVSAGMKMLNALEEFVPPRTARCSSPSDRCTRVARAGLMPPRRSPKTTGYSQAAQTPAHNRMNEFATRIAQQV